ncbi:TPA: CAAX protease, partial [Acinetobacter baumannii]
MELSNDAVLKIEQTLSIPRLSKYENFYKDKGEPYEKSDVLILYERNLLISNKFF